MVTYQGISVGSMGQPISLAGATLDCLGKFRQCFLMFPLAIAELRPIHLSDDSGQTEILMPRSINTEKSFCFLESRPPKFVWVGPWKEAAR